MVLSLGAGYQVCWGGASPGTSLKIVPSSPSLKHPGSFNCTGHTMTPACTGQSRTSHTVTPERERGQAGPTVTSPINHHLQGPVLGIQREHGTYQAHNPMQLKEPEPFPPPWKSPVTTYTGEQPCTKALSISCHTQNAPIFMANLTCPRKVELAVVLSI